jgi:hypothetical protein
MVVNNVLVDTTVFTLPFVKTDMARVKVVETTSGSSLMSGNFSLNPPANTQNFGTRAARSEALAVRNGYLWATQHDNDTIYKYKTPTLSSSSRQFVVRSGIPGTIRDLAYDAAGDQFYALVADADFGNARVYRMDTNGTATGEVTLPTATVSGITMVPQGLALVTPGSGGMLYVIDPASGNPVSQSAGLQGATGSDRRGLDWDGQGFVQGVSDAPSFNSVYTELQRFTGLENPQVVEKMPVVLSSGPNPIFFSIAYDGSSSNPAQRYYYATDTAGAFYRMPAFVVMLGVKEAAAIAGAHQASISAVTPNPLRGVGSVRFELRSRQQIRLDLYKTDGQKVMNLLEGNLEAGSHSADLASAGLASGIYYVALQTASGEREIATVVLLK